MLYEKHTKIDELYNNAIASINSKYPAYPYDLAKSELDIDRKEFIPIAAIVHIQPKKTDLNLPVITREEYEKLTKENTKYEFYTIQSHRLTNYKPKTTNTMGILFAKYSDYEKIGQWLFSEIYDNHNNN